MPITKVCQYCGDEFEVRPYKIRDGGGRFCSWKCRGAARRVRVKRRCAHCGDEFEATPSQLKYGSAKYCSWECYCASRPQLVKCKCEYCGNEFEAGSKQIEKGRGKYCSLKCRGLAKRKRFKRICEQCGEEFVTIPSRTKEGRGRYCSLECCYTSWRRRIKRICEYCGAEFETIASEVDNGNGRYCSQECYFRDRDINGENNPRWRGGASFEPYPPEFNERFKRIIRERDNYTCAICGAPDSKEVHHINYVKDDTTPENCITLCINDHARTNHNRRYWRKRLQDIMAEREIIRAEQLELALL